jgi:WD40 repeat protein
VTSIKGQSVAVVVDEISPRESRILVLDYKKLLAGRYFHAYKVMRYRPEYVQTYRSNNDRLHALASQKNGNVLCAASEENAIVVFDLESGDCKKYFPFVINLELQ